MAKKNAKHVEAALKRITEAHHIDAVVEAIIREMGGVRMLARTFKDEFHKADPGSPVKARMLDALLNLLEARSKTVNEDTLDLIDDEDLSRLAEELMEDSEDART